MKLTFPVERDVPDPISADLDLIVIDGQRYCGFTGLPRGECECWEYGPKGRFPDPEQFIGYVHGARQRPASLFARLVAQDPSFSSS